MVKQIINIEKPKIKRSIQERLKLPESITEQKTAKISIDKRNQLFVRLPSSISELAQINAGDEIEFKVSAKMPIKNKAEINFEMKLQRHKK